VKEYCKSIYICRSYDQKSSVLFLTHRVDLAFDICHVVCLHRFYTQSTAWNRLATSLVFIFVKQHNKRSTVGNKILHSLSSIQPA